MDVQPDPPENGREPPPHLGAFIMRPREIKKPNDDLMFDYDLRHPGRAIPTWQLKYHQRIVGAIGSVSKAGMVQEDERMFLERLKNIYSRLCVLMPAAQKEPAATKPFAASLEEAESELAQALDEQINSVVRARLWWNLPPLVALSALGTWLLLRLPGGEVAGNYVLAAAASMAGTVSYDTLMKFAGGPEDYDRMKRQLRNPFGRVLTTAFLAVFACAVLGTGLMDLSVGKTWHSKDAGHDILVSLIVGYLAGWPGSFLWKRLMSLVEDGKTGAPQRKGAAAQGPLMM